jgi:diguanylate cyclase (GGDEF)-like protein
MADPLTPRHLAPANADLRDDVAQVLLDRMDVIISDSVTLFPFTAPQPLDADYCGRLGQVLLQLLSAAVRDGRLDSRAGFVIDLHRLVAERGLPVEGLFTFAYLTERSALEELSVNDRVGSTSEAWPLAAQLVRRGSFDVLAAFSERIQQEPTVAAITDRLTTLYTRAMMDAVLASVLQRAERGGWPISLIILDIDRLSEINKTHGYGVGDRIVERMGIQMRKYFRQEDWVFRHSEDSIVILLSETTGTEAVTLAERVLGMVEERLSFVDHLTETRVRVTVSAAVVAVQMTSGEPVEPERLLFEAEAALERAKGRGRGGLERVDILPAALSVDVAARYLDLSPATVARLIAEGSIRATGDDPVLADRQSVETYRRTRKGPGA